VGDGSQWSEFRASEKSVRFCRENEYIKAVTAPQRGGLARKWCDLANLPRSGQLDFAAAARTAAKIGHPTLGNDELRSLLATHFLDLLDRPLNSDVRCRRESCHGLIQRLAGNLEVNGYGPHVGHDLGLTDEQDRSGGVTRSVRLDWRETAQRANPAIREHFLLVERIGIHLRFGFAFVGHEILGGLRDLARQ
jgi:hypothetical protein